MNNSTENSPLFIDLKLQIANGIGIGISVLCGIFVAIKLKLNQYIKAILLLMTTINLISLVIGLASSLAKTKELGCKMLLDSSMVMAGTFLMNSFISSLRYEMAKLASKARLVKKWQTILKIFLNAVFCYSLLPITPNLQNQFGFYNLMLICEENQDSDRPQNLKLVVLSFAGILFTLCKGMYCNLALLFFVKKTNPEQVKGASLVPWKSTNNNQEEDLQIPIRATVITSLIVFVISIVSCIFVYLTYYDDHTDPQMFTWAILLSNICTSLEPPVLVLFTVKHQMKIIASQPPQGLQFHENDPPIFIISQNRNHPPIFDNDIELQSIE